MLFVRHPVATAWRIAGEVPDDRTELLFVIQTDTHELIESVIKQLIHFIVIYFSDR